MIVVNEDLRDVIRDGWGKPPVCAGHADMRVMALSGGLALASHNPRCARMARMTKAYGSIKMIQQALAELPTTRTPASMTMSIMYARHEQI